MKQTGAGIALIAVGIALAAVVALELAPGDARGDGDNPADSLRYLEQFGQLFVYSGLALVVAGVALVVAVLGVLRILGTPSLAYSAASAFGVLSGGFLAVSGVMRMQANGTVPYIQSLDQSWGEAAYLAVQMAGTQGLLSAGMMALAAWLVALAILLIRRGSRAVALLALLPAGMLAVLVIDLVVPNLATDNDTVSSVVYVIYILCAIIGIPVACIGFGIALTTRRIQARLLPTTTAG